MDESAYWSALEYRISHELSGMSEHELRILWCDGFLPERYALQGRAPCITGRAWICCGQKQELWHFTLVLGGVAQREEIDWAALLPHRDATEWIKVDEQNQSIEMEPLAALMPEV